MDQIYTIKKIQAESHGYYKSTMALYFNFLNKHSNGLTGKSCIKFKEERIEGEDPRQDGPAR